MTGIIKIVMSRGYHIKIVYQKTRINYKVGI